MLFLQQESGIGVEADFQSQLKICDVQSLKITQIVAAQSAIPGSFFSGARTGQFSVSVNPAKTYALIIYSTVPGTAFTLTMQFAASSSGKSSQLALIVTNRQLPILMYLDILNAWKMPFDLSNAAFSPFFALLSLGHLCMGLYVSFSRKITLCAGCSASTVASVNGIRAASGPLLLTCTTIFYISGSLL